MDREATLDRLKATAADLKARYAVRSLSVFGSIARGDDHPTSDVDVLVTFEGRATFDNFMGLKLDLEELFGRRVDLLTPKALTSAMQTVIDRDAIFIS